MMPQAGRSFRHFTSLMAVVCSTLSPAQSWDAYEQFKSVAQQNSADGLRTLASTWSTSTVERERHLSLLALATAEIRDDDFRAALHLIDSLRNHVPRKEFIIHAVGQRLLANALTVLGDAERGSSEALTGLRLLPDTGYTPERIALMTAQAEAQLYTNNGLIEAYPLFVRIAQLADSVHSPTGLNGAENGIGLICLNQGRYDEAWIHFKEALRSARDAGSEMAMQNAVANLSVTATMDGQYEEALNLCDSLLNDLGERSPDFRMSLHDERGVIYRRMGRYDRALAEFVHARSLAPAGNETINSAKLDQSIAITYWMLDRKPEAIAAMNDVLKTAARLKMPDLEAEAHLQLHDWYGELKRPADALEHLRTHRILSDSLQRARYDDQLARSEALYGSAKKERRIVEQEQALHIAEANERRNSIQRNALVGATMALALVALLLFRAMRNRQRLARKEKELHDEQVDSLLSQQEIKSINAMLDGQEKERARVSKDLHDHVGSLLGAIKHQLATLETQVADVKTEQNAQYHKVNGLLDNAAGQLRRISHDMAAATLNRFGLEKALKDLRDTIHINGRLNVELKTFGLDDRLERSVELAIYRIVQELISNVLKHANARELSIAVTRGPGRLSLVVSDDGVGFDPAIASTGIGLGNVRSRAAALGAIVQLDSTPGQGTTVSVECPVVE
jgi:signal transduction histidine kinase